MGKHYKEEEVSEPDTAFEDIVQGLEVDKAVKCCQEDCDRPAVCRVTVCGHDDAELMCGLCWQAQITGMSAGLAQALRHGIPVCEPCGKPIPLLPFIMEHVQCDYIEQEASSDDE